jgi:hypothetical protein
MKKLDLHGVRHEDVRLEVTKFIEAGFTADEECEIVFGHSLKMWNLVEEVLDEYDALLSFSLGGPLGMGRTHVSLRWK